MKMIIQLCMPDPLPQGEKRKELPRKVSVEEKVRDALECIDSGHPSHVEWIMIKKLYAALQKKEKKSKRVLNIMKMIEPVLAKYGHFKVGEE